MTASLAARDWLEGLDADTVLRGQGADAARVRARSPRLVATAERAAREGVAMLEPRVSCRILAVRSREPERILLEGGAALTGPLVAARLRGACAVAVLVATIGQRLENRVSRMFGRDLPYALALDGLGSAAVERLARSARRLLGDRARTDGRCAMAPFSPGMEGWSLRVGQEEILRLLDANACGVRLTEEGFLVPRKTLTVAFGLGLGVAAGDDEELCDSCASRSRCRHRRLDETHR